MFDFGSLLTAIFELLLSFIIGQNGLFSSLLGAWGS